MAPLTTKPPAGMLAAVDTARAELAAAKLRACAGGDMRALCFNAMRRCPAGVGVLLLPSKGVQR